MDEHHQMITRKNEVKQNFVFLCSHVPCGMLGSELREDCWPVFHCFVSVFYFHGSHFVTIYDPQGQGYWTSFKDLYLGNLGKDLQLRAVLSFRSWTRNFQFAGPFGQTLREVVSTSSTPYRPRLVA